MHNFTKRVHLQSGFDAEFSFNKIHTVNSGYYHVSVKDQYGQNYFFSIGKINTIWKIVDAPKIPDWIIAVEGNLIQTVFANQPETSNCQ